MSFNAKKKVKRAEVGKTELSLKWQDLFKEDALTEEDLVDLEEV